jgi:hypothetical protein
VLGVGEFEQFDGRAVFDNERERAGAEARLFLWRNLPGLKVGGSTAASLARGTLRAEAWRMDERLRRPFPSWADLVPVKRKARLSGPSGGNLLHQCRSFDCALDGAGRVWIRVALRSG